MRLFLVLGVACIFTVGCKPAPEVRTYQVSKPRPPKRMLAAMVPVEGGAWFFKLIGPYRSVSDHTEPFWKFVESVRVSPDSGEPAYDVPAGWRERPPKLGEMRYATVEIPGDFPLEISITSFDRPQGLNAAEFELANINRWRRQLSASEAKPGGIDEVITRRRLGELEALCVDVAGKEPPRGGMAGGAPPPPRRDPSPPPKFEVPSQWQSRPLKPFSVATFAVADATADADEPLVTISEVGGGLMANAARWYRQARVPAPTSLSEVEEQMKAIDGAQSGARLLLLAADDDPSTTMIAVAVLQHAGADWYIKYTGPRGVWDQQRDAFEAIVKSIEFSGANE